MNVQDDTNALRCLPIDRLPDEHVTRDEVDHVLRALAQGRHASDYQLCQWLACGFRLEVHRAYGYASFREYAERFFGFTGRQTEERLRMCGELAKLSELTAAFREGRLASSIVRELSRVASAGTEGEWIERAAGRTAQEVERLVAGHHKGQRPSDRPEARLDPQRWRLLLLPENYGLMGRVRAELVARTGRALSDDELAVLIAERVFAGGSTHADDGEEHLGRAPFQIALHVCESCGQASTGDGVAVSEATVSMAECDAQQLGRVDVREPGRATQKIPPRIRRMVLLRQGKRCGAPGCRNLAFVHIHHVEPLADGGTHDPERLVPLCSAHHRAVHEGRLIVRGTYSAGFKVEHADGAAYGSASASGAASSTLADVFGALTSMGWKHKQAQSMLDAIRPHVGAELSLEQVLRMALAAAPLSCMREECAGYARSVVSGAAAPTWGQA